MSDKNSTNVSVNTKTTYNYPELGGPDQVSRWYNNGETLVHPGGLTYIRVNGNWVIKKDDGK